MKGRRPYLSAGFLLRPPVVGKTAMAGASCPSRSTVPGSGSLTERDAIDSFHATPEVIEEFGIAANAPGR